MGELIHFFLLAGAVGVVGGLLGIGGAIIIIPVLIYSFGWPELIAQGTSLAMMLPPVGLLAVWQYHKAGAIRVAAAIIAAVCFIPSAYAGALLAGVLPAEDLERLFGLFAALLALNMIGRPHKANEENSGASANCEP